jgi:hypothetical protein
MYVVKVLGFHIVGRLLSRGDSELYGPLDRIQDAALQVIRHYAPRLGMFFCAA